MTTRQAHLRRPLARSKGLSLIELLVAMAIGLVVTLAITRIMIGFEGSKRTSTALNDTIQAGAYGSYVLNRAIRQAGTGYTQRLSDLFGCRLNAAKASLGTSVLPPPSAFPSPFSGASTVRRLAPFLIEQGAADTASEVRGDILTVLSGAGGKSELPLPASTFTVMPSPSFSLPLTIEYRPNDLVLIGGDRGAVRDCMVQQVAAGVAPGMLPLGGDYYTATGTTVNFTDFSSMSTVYAAQLGNIDNPPQFYLYGVGDNATLFSYDLLQTGATAAANQPQAVADSVVEVRALYGLDTNFDHTVDRWQDPGVSPFQYADLMSGTSAALNNLKQITAVRVGLILRSPLQEATTVASNPVLFAGVTDAGGTSLERTRTLTAADQAFRYRTVELTIPLRNMQFAPLP